MTLTAWWNISSSTRYSIGRTHHPNLCYDWSILSLIFHRTGPTKLCSYFYYLTFLCTQLLVVSKRLCVTQISPSYFNLLGTQIAAIIFWWASKGPNKSWCLEKASSTNMIWCQYTWVLWLIKIIFFNRGIIEFDYFSTQCRVDPSTLTIHNVTLVLEFTIKGMEIVPTHFFRIRFVHIARFWYALRTKKFSDSTHSSWI